MIDNLKDLERFFKLCRKQGIIKADLVNQAFEFGELPIERAPGSIQESVENPYSNFPMGELTPDQLAFYSSGGLPQDDPALKAS